MPFSVRDRRILTLMIVAGFVQSFAGSVLTVTLPFWRVSLELTQADTSLVMALVRLGTMTSLAFALYGDRWGRRRPLLLALAALLALNVATALVPGVIALTVLQSFARAASAAVASLAIVYLAEELAPLRRSFGMGVWALSASLAGGLVYIIVPAFDEGDAWRWLLALSGLGVVALPLLARFLKESRAYAPPAERPSLTAPMRGDSAGRFWLLAVAAFLVGAFTAPAVTFAFDHLVNDLGWTTGSARLAIIGGGAAGSSGLFLGGRFADVVGRRPTIAVSIIVGVVGAFGFYWQEGPILILWIVVAAFGSSSFVPAFAAHRSELFPTVHRAVAGAWLTSISVLGGMTSLVIGFWTIDSWGLSETVSVFGLGALLAVMLLLRLPETRGLDLTAGRAARDDTVVR